VPLAFVHLQTAREVRACACACVRVRGCVFVHVCVCMCMCACARVRVRACRRACVCRWQLRVCLCVRLPVSVTGCPSLTADRNLPRRKRVLRASPPRAAVVTGTDAVGVRDERRRGRADRKPLRTSAGYSHVTQWVLTGVLSGYSPGTHWVFNEYSRGTHGVRD
jgi:hypothetical protein